VRYVDVELCKLDWIRIVWRELCSAGNGKYIGAELFSLGGGLIVVEGEELCTKDNGTFVPHCW
jgi:hypothetical protein